MTQEIEQQNKEIIILLGKQAFEDVNKRTSHLNCNIPFIKSNLCPLSFTGVTRDDYTTALLVIYEKNDVGPMLELFAWAYSRSCEQYGVVKKSLGKLMPSTFNTDNSEKQPWAKS